MTIRQIWHSWKNFPGTSKRPYETTGKVLNSVLDFIAPSWVGRASLVAQLVKNPPAMQETLVGFLGQEDPLEKEWQTTPVFLPGKSVEQRNLAGYSSWGHKESDMTEHACTFIYRNRNNPTIPKLKEISKGHFIHFLSLGQTLSDSWKSTIFVIIILWTWVFYGLLGKVLHCQDISCLPWILSTRWLRDSSYP